MAEDYYDLLGIPSPESQAVRQLLTPSSQSRPYYSDPSSQSLSDTRTAQSQNFQRQEAQNLQSDLQADLARRMTLPTESGNMARTMAFKQALKQAQYERATTSLLDDLKKLDPGDPESLSMQDEIIAKHPISREALKDPRVSNLVKRQAEANAEMGEIFDKDPDSLAEYAALKTSGADPETARKTVKSNAQRRADRVWFASLGGNPADFDSGKFNDANGRPDRAQMAYELNQLKRQPSQQMSALESRQLDDAAKNIGEISDLQKKAAFRASQGKDPVSEEDWSLAWNLANDAMRPEREGVAAIVQDLENQGKVVPARYKEMSGLVQPTAGVPQNTGGQNAIVPQATSDGETPIPVVNSVAELRALKLAPGSKFKTPDGKTGTVK